MGRRERKGALPRTGGRERLSTARPHVPSRLHDLPDFLAFPGAKCLCGPPEAELLAAGSRPPLSGLLPGGWGSAATTEKVPSVCAVSASPTLRSGPTLPPRKLPPPYNAPACSATDRPRRWKHAGMRDTAGFNPFVGKGLQREPTAGACSPLRAYRGGSCSPPGSHCPLPWPCLCTLVRQRLASETGA
jgi:hypothetical protein